MAKKKTRGSKRSSPRSSPKKSVKRKVSKPAARKRVVVKRRAKPAVKKRKQISRARPKSRARVVVKRRAAPVKRKAAAKPKPKSRVSYKAEYVKLLQKTNKTFEKEIKTIREAIEKGNVKMPEPEIPVTGTPKRLPPGTLATVKDVLDEIRAMRGEIAERNRKLNELMTQPGTA